MTIKTIISGIADIEGYALWKYGQLDAETKRIVDLRANELIEAFKEKQRERKGTGSRSPFGFQSALTLLLLTDTLYNELA